MLFFPTLQLFNGSDIPVPLPLCSAKKKSRAARAASDSILWRGHLTLARPQNSRQDGGTANQHTTF
jgi:hypothetical protein